MVDSSTVGIIVNELVRGYGSTAVIQNLNLKAHKGTIYGLLGPSGCGKTTLLKLILGRLAPDAGTINVLGFAPHTPNHHIPGSQIGYAPQETALYSDLSISETLQFHASLHGLSSEEFNERKKWLMEFLELPSEKKIIRQLSGGQERRVSLAVALLHNPEVLILDEPTVGVDPLLRLRIWEHLRSIAKLGTTIVITTHYIEEARHADCVGLMRNGRLLEEGNPEILMKKYGHSSLEDVFLDLCRNVKVAKQVENSINFTEKSNIISTESTTESTNDSIHSKEIENERSPLINNRLHFKKKITWTRHLYHVFAISRRKFTQLLRNPITLAFEILVPTVQIFLFMLCIGPLPNYLPFAIVNQDVGYSIPAIGIYNVGSDLAYYLSNGTELKITNYTNLNEAIEAVKLGKEWGVIYMPPTLSKALYFRIFNPHNQTIQNESTISLYQDLSNYQISLVVDQKIADASEETIEKLFNASVNPLKIETPIYGKLNSKFSDFLAPGMIALMTYAHAIGITAIAFVRERCDSTMDRIFAAGVKATSIIIAHFLTHIGVILVQTCLLLVVAVFGFHTPVQGFLLEVFLLQLLLGSVGMSFGLVISSVSRQETEAVQIALASFFPSMLLSGVIWPLEAIPYWFSWLSKILPTTWACDANRAIMIRGWGITRREVWLAFVVCGAWAFVWLFVASWNLSSTDKQNWWRRRKSLQEVKKTVF